MNLDNLSVEELLAEINKRGVTTQTSIPSFTWNNKTYSGESFTDIARKMKDDGLTYNLNTVSERIGWLASGCWGISIAEQSDAVHTPVVETKPWTPPGFYVYRYRRFNERLQQWVDCYYGSGRGNRVWAPHNNSKFGDFDPADFKVDILIAGLPNREVAEEIEAWLVRKEHRYGNLLNVDLMTDTRGRESFYATRYRTVYIKDNQPVWADNGQREQNIKSVANYSYIVNKNQYGVCPVEFDYAVVLVEDAADSYRKGEQ